MLKALGDFITKKHSAIAGTLFAASALGSFTYTLTHGRSAWLDATTMMSNEEPSAANEVTYQYKMRFR